MNLFSSFNSSYFGLLQRSLMFFLTASLFALFISTCMLLDCVLWVFKFNLVHGICALVLHCICLYETTNCSLSW